MRYADHDYYINEYGSDLMPPEKFEFFAGKARDRINEAIFGREIPAEFVSKVKRCCCEIADELYRASASQNSPEDGNIESEKIGSYSISYRSRSEQLKADAALDEACYKIIERHLAETGLLYRGVN